MTSKLLAGCVLLNEQRRVLLIHRNTPQLTQWELPGGKPESGESLSQAAEREVWEEAGVKVQVKTQLGSTKFQDNGILWHYTWFLAEIISGELRAVESDRYDGVEYFDLLDPRIEGKGISINIINLIRAIKAGEVRL